MQVPVPLGNCYRRKYRRSSRQCMCSLPVVNQRCSVYHVARVVNTLEEKKKGKQENLKKRHQLSFLGCIWQPFKNQDFALYSIKYVHLLFHQVDIVSFSISNNTAK